MGTMPASVLNIRLTWAAAQADSPMLPDDYQAIAWVFLAEK